MKVIFEWGRVFLKNISFKIGLCDFWREIIFFLLRFVKYFLFCIDVNSKIFLVSEGFKNLVIFIKE